MKNKKRDLTALVLVIVILMLLNYVGSFVFHRFDLTSEKRYTLSNATKKLLSTLDDVVYVKVYLGKNEDFPAGFKHLRNETEEMLNEFRSYSNNSIEYEFINLSENTDEKQKGEVFKQLYDKGLQPTNLEVKEESGVTQKIIWPGALVSYKGKETHWQLLKTQLGASPEMQLNNSVQALEYEFASCIRNLSTTVRPQIAFIKGHGESDGLEIMDIKNSLSEFYDVKSITIADNINALKKIKAIIIAKPDTAFSENDKYIIDQYIMNGGKALWVMDALETSVDSLRKSGFTLAITYNLNLEDLFFKYGVRINPNLVVDLQASAIPVNKAFVGQEPRFELMPWLFSPLIMPLNNHPIVKNLEVIKMDFASTIDTIATKRINKTILLKTSRYSKIVKAPVRIDMRMVNVRPDESLLNDSYQTVAILAEGKFESVFKNRARPEIAEKIAILYKAESNSTKMIFISDGDVIRNDVQYSSSKPYPLGFDKYTNQTYGNKNFILNCVNYLCDDSGLITVRARELTLRMLNKKKIHHEKLKWQLINAVFPIFVILLFGVIYAYFRNRKYAR
jgi:ABC-2 type transport system permease protein